ncbi:acylneuraminate cytidylyltransferase family protein [Aliiglaciecola aliphaticivorans]
MRELGKVLAHIPARAGSKRVKAKNLRLLNGKPLLAYSVEAALQASNEFDGVFVNSDSDDMLRLAKKLGASTYKRSEELASDTATGDEFTYDFILKEKPDTLVMISPVCPLIDSLEILRAIEQFKQSKCDTLITCEQTQMQTFCEGRAVNIDADGQLRPTQENPVVQILNWAVTIWDAKKFVENFEKHGSAYIGKNRELLAIDPIKAVKISKEGDFSLAESLIRSQSQMKKTEPEFWS